jgi:hypothetical protein
MANIIIERDSIATKIVRKQIMLEGEYQMVLKEKNVELRKVHMY